MSNIWQPKIEAVLAVALDTASSDVSTGNRYRTLASYALAPDDELLDLNAEPDNPRAIYFSDPNSIAEVQGEFERMIGAPPTDEEKMRESIRHEIDHGEVASRLGATTLLFGIEFWRDGDYLKLTPFQLSPTWRPTKLAFARVALGPTVPSKGDLAIVTKLGYADASQVLTRAAKLE